MSGPLLIPLTCDRCGGELRGGPGALVYLCYDCGLARFATRMERSYPLRYVKPKLGSRGQSVVFAPFWRLEGRASVHAEDPAKARVIRNLKPLGPLYFPAFWNPKAAYCDNLTLRYASSPEVPEFEEGREPVLDGVRDPEALPEMARLTWLAYLDRAVDVTGVELAYEPVEVRYAAVPFFRAGDFYLDGLLGIQVPGSYLSGGAPGSRA